MNHCRSYSNIKVFKILFSNNPKEVSSKVKFLILDILELNKNGWGIKQEDQLKKKDEFAADVLKTSRKNSEFIPGVTSSRKSSINPSNVEYIKRSRFNSRADELKVNKENDPNLVDELVSHLGADIEFYQCFRLTEEEFVYKLI